MRNYLFYIAFLLTIVVLVFYGYIGKDSSHAIVAEVEPQKTAISFPKPVRIRALHVKPGERVKEGDVLVEVERPDLELDIQKVNNTMEQVRTEIAKEEENFEAKQRVNQLDLQQELAALEKQLSVLMEERKSDSIVFRTFNQASDSFSNTAYDVRKKSLIREMQITNNRYVQERRRQKAIFDRDVESLKLRESRLLEEHEALLTEQQNLKRFATFNGTIGNVSVQLQELVPPYRTIMSIYDEDPNIIRAFMNEQADVEVSTGQKVRVEAFSRSNQVEGEIVEIGSRIVSYPRQMNPNNANPMWGKELFVQIPDKSGFLNGEKVYVIIDER